MVTDEVVEPTVLVDRGQHAQRHADDDGEERGHRAEMKRDRKRAADDLVYRLRTGVIGNAEVEVDRVPDVADELLGQRLVEPVERFESLNILGPLLVADVERAARRGVHDQERERGHRQERRNEPEDPVQGESQHAGSGLLTGVLRRSRERESPGRPSDPCIQVSADAMALRLPITSTRPNTVVKVRQCAPHD